MTSPAPTGALVLLHAIEPSWTPFLTEWLGAAGHRVLADAGDADGQGRDPGDRTAPHLKPWPPRPAPAQPRLLVTGLAFPRRDGGAAIAALRRRWPSTPILLLSPTLRAAAAVGGPLAVELGVQAVAPMPITRDALLAVVARTLDATLPSVLATPTSAVAAPGGPAPGGRAP